MKFEIPSTLVEFTYHHDGETRTGLVDFVEASQYLAEFAEPQGTTTHQMIEKFQLWLAEQGWPMAYGQAATLIGDIGRASAEFKKKRQAMQTSPPTTG